jgi:hypothetical protein
VVDEINPIAAASTAEGAESVAAMGILRRTLQNLHLNTPDLNGFLYIFLPIFKKNAKQWYYP